MISVKQPNKDMNSVEGTELGDKGMGLFPSIDKMLIMEQMDFNQTHRVHNNDYLLWSQRESIKSFAKKVGDYTVDFCKKQSAKRRIIQRNYSASPDLNEDQVENSEVEE